MLPEQSTKVGEQRGPIRVHSVAGLVDVDATAWDELNPSGSPFLTHTFLSQLEQHGMVGAGTGWVPRHALAQRENSLLAAIPIYEKTDSFGEFVFDWVWADAYQRAGAAYFPKLIAAVPFTPVPGDRLLARKQTDRMAALPALLEHLQSSLDNDGYSSVHILFPGELDVELLGKNGFLPRLDCRFLWRNGGYADFEDFLQIFSARQRKNIRSERRKVRDAGVSFEWLQGDQVNSKTWLQVHTICASTFLRRGQLPYLNAEFFESLAKRMPKKLLVNIARLDGQIVAAAIFFRDQQKLYGRYWGSVMHIDCLHFECCYYQGIEFAIDRKLEFFDPGTQGEHKLRRGFAPIESWSMHRFANERMAGAVGAWLAREKQVIQNYILNCRKDMPFSDQFEGVAAPL